MDISAVLLRMLRLRALAVILIFAAVALVTNGYAIERHPGSVLLVALLLAGWYVNGTCINDLADEAIDKINLPKAVGRPLANGNASRRQLTVLASGAALFVVLLSAALDYRLAILSIAMLLLNWLYSMPPVRISYRGVFAPLLLPLGYVLYPYLAAVYVQHIALVRWDFVLLAALYVGFIGRIVLKDFRDVKGDRQYHKRTFIVRLRTAGDHYLQRCILEPGKRTADRSVLAS
ncbi:MAG: UbiA family prenyltransferase [Candidatus Saccharibacteria bacterium]